GLYSSQSDYSADGYLVFIGSNLPAKRLCPSIPTNWKLILTRDFNNDGKPDYVLYNLITHQTALWHLNNNVLAGGAYGPTLPDSWALVGAADFNHDGNQDYLLYNASTKKSAIWYLSDPNFLSGQYGPTMDPLLNWSVQPISRFMSIRTAILILCFSL